MLRRGRKECKEQQKKGKRKRHEEEGEGEEAGRHGQIPDAMRYGSSRETAEQMAGKMPPGKPVSFLSMQVKQEVVIRPADERP